MLWALALAIPPIRVFSVTVIGFPLIRSSAGSRARERFADITVKLC